MPLNDPQKAELIKILDSDLFKTAKDEVLRITDGPIYELAAPEQAMALAVEKGVRKAFRSLEQICKPNKEPSPLPLKNNIKPNRLTQ